MSDDDQKVDIYMRLYVAEYLADTQRFTAEEHGIYLLLLMDYWRSGPIPDDTKTLCRITKLTPKRLRTASKSVLKKFQLQNGFWTHKRVEKELTLARGAKAKCVERAKKAAEARWKRDATSNATSNAPSMPQPMLQAMLKQCPPNHPTTQPSLLQGVEISGSDATSINSLVFSDEIKTDPEAKHFDLAHQDLSSGRFRLKKFKHMWMHFHELSQAREKFLASGLSRDEWLDCIRVCDVSMEGKKNRIDFKGGLAFKYLMTHILTDALNQRKTKNQANGVFGPPPKPTTTSPARRVVRSETSPTSIGKILNTIKQTD